MSTCETCAWWKRARQYAQLGDCRRHAPTVQYLSVVTEEPYDSEHGRWPQAHSADWCGDWTQRGEAEVTT